MRRSAPRRVERAMAIAATRPSWPVPYQSPPPALPAPSSMVALVKLVEAGTNELDAAVDDLRPRFQAAMQKGREGMDQVRAHIERVVKSVETIEDIEA